MSLFSIFRIAGSDASYLTNGFLEIEIGCFSPFSLLWRKLVKKLADRHIGKGCVSYQLRIGRGLCLTSATLSTSVPALLGHTQW